jgi:hypothetical protein
MAIHGDAFTRAWRLYLAGSEAAFRTGWMQLFQIVLGRAPTEDVRWRTGSNRTSGGSETAARVIEQASWL